MHRVCCRDHPCSRGEGLEDGLLLLLWGLRGLRLHRQPQSHHGAQIHAFVQNCPKLVSLLVIPSEGWTILIHSYEGLFISLFLVFFSPEEVQALISGKLALRYAGRQARTRRFLCYKCQLFNPQSFCSLSDRQDCTPCHFLSNTSVLCLLSLLVFLQNDI